MITLKNITLKFDHKILLKDFNLTISEHEKILFNAPSGSGKSSLVKALLGLVKYTGEIYFNDKLLSKETKDFFRKNIAYVSQDVDLQNLVIKDLFKEIFAYKVNKHLLYDEVKLIQLLQQFQLSEDHLSKTISELSGGERARIGLIIGLLLDREILILDEVTAGLDETLKLELIDYICKLNKTMIVISHDKAWMDRQEIRVVKW